MMVSLRESPSLVAVATTVAAERGGGEGGRGEEGGGGRGAPGAEGGGKGAMTTAYPRTVAERPARRSAAARPPLCRRAPSERAIQPASNTKNTQNAACDRGAVRFSDFAHRDEVVDSRGLHRSVRRSEVRGDVLDGEGDEHRRLELRGERAEGRAQRRHRRGGGAALPGAGQQETRSRRRGGIGAEASDLRPRPRRRNVCQGFLCTLATHAQTAATSPASADAPRLE